MLLETHSAFWQFLMHHWAVLAIVGTCASLLLFVVLLLAKYVRIALNIFVDTPPPLSLDPRDFQILRGEEVRFRSFDGTSLRGMWLRTRNRGACRGVVVFCHEFGSDMFSCARYAAPLLEADFDVFTFDFRGHGQSSAQPGYKLLQWPSDKELEDVLGATAYVEDALASAGLSPRVGVFGISRGAGSAILAASSDPNIACLALDGAFSTRHTLVTLMKRWAYIFARVKLVYENHPDAFWHFLLWLVLRFAQPKLGRRFPSVSLALKHMTPRPVFFIHGQRDSYIRPHVTRILYHAAAEPKYLWMVPQAKHNQSVTVAPEDYAARTTAFFRKYLAGEAVDEREITGPPASAEVA